MATVRGREETHTFGPPPGRRAKAEDSDCAPEGPEMAMRPFASRDQVKGKVNGSLLRDITSNVFHIRPSPGAQICLYSVQFKPSIPEEHRKDRRAVFEACTRCLFGRRPNPDGGETAEGERGGSCIYDDLGNLAMTTRPLSDEVLSQGIDVFITQKKVKKDYTVRFSYRKQVSFDNEHDAALCEQLANNLMRRALDRRRDMSAVGNSFMLTSETGVENRVMKCKLHTAFTLTVRKLISGLFCVVEISKKPLFPHAIAAQMMSIHQNARGDEKLALKECDKKLKKLIIYTPHNKKTYKVIGVDAICRGPKAADGSQPDVVNNALRTFSRFNKDTKMKENISFADYFASINLALKHPELPLIKCKAVNGKEANICHLPPELCWEAGWNKTHFNQHAQEMLQTCSLEPGERMLDTKKVIRLVATEGDAAASETPTAKLLRDFGLSISEQPFELRPLLLAPPRVVVKNKQGGEIPSAFEPNSSPLGNVYGNVSGKQVLDRGIKINFVLILVPDRDERRAREFWSAWTEISSNFGASFNPKPEVIPYSRRDFNSCVDRGVDMLRQACGDQDLRAQCFVVAIGDAKDEELYRYFKNTMYSNGLASQVCYLTKILKQGGINKSVVVNLTLKGLCKIGGVPWSVQQSGDYAEVFTAGKAPIMIVGIDTSCNMKKVAVDRPSPLACVASYDASASKFYSRSYPASADERTHTENMKDFFMNAIHQYAKANGGPPKSIVVYRAGLNRSQQVVAEADQTLVALDAMWQENSPDIPKPCVVIVHTSKRSAIRLFAKRGTNHFDNVVAGTIIDEGITSDSIFDFELVANNTNKIGARMPTCVPTNYKVLRVRGNVKEGIFNPDLSQGVCDKDWITKLTFALSHLYFCYIRGSCRLPNVLTWANRCAEKCGLAETEPDATTHNTLYYS